MAMERAGRRPGTSETHLYEWEVVAERDGRENVLSCGVSDSEISATAHLTSALSAAPPGATTRGRIREIEVRIFGAPAYDRKALVSQAERCFDGRIVWTPPGGE